MSRRNRQKVEEKPVDYLDDLVNTSITQPIEELVEEPETQEIIPEIIEEPIFKPVEDKSYNIKVLHSPVYIRNAPSGQAEVVGSITDRGVYKIIDKVDVFGKLDENKWINLCYTKTI